MPLANGQIFAGYRVLRRLGSGAMGEVYLAQHPRLPRQDALKVLAADVSADAEYRARFNREADLASTLWHPHIVGVHDRGEEEGQLWISMDFVDGLDVARLLADRYPAGMPVEEVARIVTAVASALDYAHKQGLLHRDVKPANIMMTHLDDEGEQRILLTDFGIARNVNDISGLTKTNMAVGTVAYCAPEQLLGEDIDGRADQYSLAATAFHLLTGSQLFPNSNPAVVISRHLNVPPPALADSRPELAKLDPVLAIGLAKRPQDRFNRCSDFARALSEQINPGVPTTSAPTASAPRAVRPMDAAPPHQDLVDPRKRWKLWVAALVVVAALGGAGIYLGTTKSNDTTATSTTTTQSSPTASQRSTSDTVRATSSNLVTQPGTTKPKAVVSFYEDFLCPACGNFERTFGPTVSKLIDIGAIAADYSMVSILDSPRNQNYSSRAGAAALCVADESTDAFRRFYNGLFSSGIMPNERGTSFPDNTRLIEIAQEAGASGTVPDCVNSGKCLSQVTGEAVAANITAVPTIKINGEDYEPSTLDAMVAKIKDIVGNVPGIDSAATPVTP